MKEKFSLKDALFNEKKVTQSATEIKKVYPEFKAGAFIKKVVGKFPELELKQRIRWISDCLKEFLPEDYRKATTVLVKSLPPPNDHTKTDNDFGDFIYAPYTDFIAINGCNRKDLQFSLQALKEMTMRFSAEDSIRYFINAFQEETLKELEKWSYDSHYHVRRLVSEGTRPKLPWAQKITLSVERAIPLLSHLYADNTRFVTRSVANHMNDISKIKPELVVETLKKWKAAKKQNAKEMEYIINHSLRTLVKLGYKDAIEFLDFSAEPQVSVSNFKILNQKVPLGQALEFLFDITADKDEALIIDYILYFPGKSGKGMNKKVFKIKKINIKKGQTIQVSKKHPLRATMTTRKLQPGKHLLEIQINGKKMLQKEFELIPS